jgi:hypothetical protein
MIKVTKTKKEILIPLLRLPLNVRLVQGSGALITADFQGHRIQGGFFTQVPLQGPLLHIAVVLVMRAAVLTVLVVRGGQTRALLAVLVVRGGGQTRALRQVARVLLVLSVHAAQVVQQVRLGDYVPTSLQAVIGTPVKRKVKGGTNENGVDCGRLHVWYCGVWMIFFSIWPPSWKIHISVSPLSS